MDSGWVGGKRSGDGVLASQWGNRRLGIHTIKTRLERLSFKEALIWFSISNKKSLLYRTQTNGENG